jgi:hypothetical protein
MIRQRHPKANNQRRRALLRIGSGLEEIEPRVLLSTAAFLLTSDWGTGFGGQITISNTQTTAVNNWSLSFDWDRSITSIWNGTIASHVGNEYVITNAGWNASIAPGGAAEFGFNGSPGKVGSDVPTSYALNGVALGASAPPALSINNVTVNDGTAGATAAFTVSLSKAAATAVTVSYATANGTATAGTDFLATSGTLTFAPGTVTEMVDVPINPDATAKSNLTFQVALSSAVGATLATTAGTGTIVDTIAPPVTSAATASFEVTSDWGSGFGGQITVTNQGSSAINNWALSFTWDRTISSIWDASIVSHSGSQYVINNAGWNSTIAGGSSVSFGFNGSPGVVGTDVPSKYILNGVALGAGVPSLNITNLSVDDGTSGTTALFTVTLSQPSTASITVKYATANGTAVAGTDFKAASGTLTFAPGTLSETIPITINPDTTAKANLTFQVVLSSASGADIATGSGVGTIIDSIGLPPVPPVAANVTTETLEGTAATVNVLSDATDSSGYALTLASYTQPGHGAVTENSGDMLVYTPAAGFLGADSFTYTVSDGHGETATATVAISVIAPATASNWPAHVFAPYVDMTLYPTYNLTAAMQTAGIKYFTLAFITAGPNDEPAWGGYSEYDVNGGAFDLSIRAQIIQVRSAGGDVSVSFGGEAGSELAQVVTNVNTLTADYQQVITAYGLTHIDFDIEGAAVANNASIDRRSQAIAALEQAATAAGKTLDVSFTLPVLPSGLTATGLYVLQSALKYGAKISLVNVMAMDYGDSAAPNPAGQMGTYAIDAAKSTFTQLQGLYGTTLSTSQLWQMVGVTTLIGVNDVADEVFEPADASQLLAFAESVGMGEISMWSLARDKEDPDGALKYSEDNSSSIVQTPFEFSDIFNAYTAYS